MASAPGSSVNVDGQSEPPYPPPTREEIEILDRHQADYEDALRRAKDNLKSLKRKRRPFSAEQRKESQMVRAIGACDNCRKRKLKVSSSAFLLFL
jgi:hypothetical protein